MDLRTHSFLRRSVIAPNFDFKRVKIPKDATPLLVKNDTLRDRRMYLLHGRDSTDDRTGPDH